MTKTTQTYHGVVVPMISPLTDDGAVDESAVQRIIDRFVDAGHTGVFVLGTTGEAMSMSFALRQHLVQCAIQAANSRLKVYAGISSNCMAESIEHAHAWHEAGADVLVAHAPGYYEVPERTLETYFVTLADQLPLPLMAYNMPKTMHHSIPLDVVDSLSQHSNIVGMKDSQADAQRLTQLAERFGDDPAFSLLIGCAWLSCDGLRAGADGMVPSGGNVAPELCQHLYEAACAGHWDEAEEHQQQLDVLGARYMEGYTLGESLVLLKAMMAEQGLCSATVLPPLQAVVKKTKETV